MQLEDVCECASISRNDGLKRGYVRGEHLTDIGLVRLVRSAGLGDVCEQDCGVRAREGRDIDAVEGAGAMREQGGGGGREGERVGCEDGVPAGGDFEAG